MPNWQPLIEPIPLPFSDSGSGYTDSELSLSHSQVPAKTTIVSCRPCRYNSVLRAQAVFDANRTRVHAYNSYEAKQ
jgi:hypothetical protein